ncbi:hypothetical protein [Methanolobus sp. WCC4]
MVTQIQLEQKDNATPVRSAIADDPCVRKEDEGFYSSCGQAYIRIDRN